MNQIRSFVLAALFVFLPFDNLYGGMVSTLNTGLALGAFRVEDDVFSLRGAGLGGAFGFEWGKDASRLSVGASAQYFGLQYQVDNVEKSIRWYLVGAYVSWQNRFTEVWRWQVKGHYFPSSQYYVFSQAKIAANEVSTTTKEYSLYSGNAAWMAELNLNSGIGRIKSTAAYQTYWGGGMSFTSQDFTAVKQRLISKESGEAGTSEARRSEKGRYQVQVIMLSLLLGFSF